MRQRMGGDRMAGSRALGDALRRRMEAKGLTQERVAAAVERSQSWVSRVLSGEIAISEEDLDTWGTLVGASPDELWREAGGKPTRPSMARDALLDLLRVRVLDQEGSASLQGGVLLGYTLIPPEDAFAHRDVVAIRVRGACLEPEIKNGDHAIVDTEQTAVNGSIVVAVVEDTLQIKRLAIRRGKYILTSNEPEELEIDPICIEGVVFKIVRDVR